MNGEGDVYGETSWGMADTFVIGNRCRGVRPDAPTMAHIANGVGEHEDSR